MYPLYALYSLICFILSRAVLRKQYVRNDLSDMAACCAVWLVAGRQMCEYRSA